MTDLNLIHLLIEYTQDNNLKHKPESHGSDDTALQQFFNDCDEQTVLTFLNTHQKNIGDNALLGNEQQIFKIALKKHFYHAFIKAFTMLSTNQQQHHEALIKQWSSTISQSFRNFIINPQQVSIIESLPRKIKEMLIVSMDEDQATPLHWACRRHDKKMLEALLKDLNSKSIFAGLLKQDKDGNTPLHDLCMTELEFLIPVLFNKLSTDEVVTLITKKNSLEECPLEMACYHHHNLNLITFLLFPLNDEQKLDAFKQLKHPLHAACASGDSSLVRLVMSQINDPIKSLQRFDDFGLELNQATPLHWACDQHSCASVIALLNNLTIDEKFQILQIKDALGQSPLSIACLGHQVNIIRKLIEGLNPDQKYELLKQQFLLHSAAKYHNEKIITLLLKELPSQKTLNLVNQIDSSLCTPAHLCAMRNSGTSKKIIAIVKNLDNNDLEQCLQKVNAHENNMLHLMCMNNHINALDNTLSQLSHDAITRLINQTNSHHYTPLHVACLKPDVALTKCFIKHTLPSQLYSLIVHKTVQNKSLLSILCTMSNDSLHPHINDINTIVDQLLNHLHLEHLVILQSHEPLPIIQIPDEYQPLIRLGIDFTIPFKQLDHQQKLLIRDNLHIITQYLPSLISSHIIPSYKDLENNDKIFFLDTLEIFVETKPKMKTEEHEHLLKKLKDSLAKQDLTQEESMTLLMQDMKHYRLRHETINRIEDFLEKLSKHPSTKQLSTLIDHAITELTQ
ncbi:MAG: ankyrin repeat domain-containing protein, partial [Candidatus Comchoanobacterales bacterium]